MNIHEGNTFNFRYRLFYETTKDRILPDSKSPTIISLVKYLGPVLKYNWHKVYLQLPY